MAARELLVTANIKRQSAATFRSTIRRRTPASQPRMPARKSSIPVPSTRSLSKLSVRRSDARRELERSQTCRGCIARCRKGIASNYSGGFHRPHSWPAKSAVKLMTLDGLRTAVLVTKFKPYFVDTAQRTNVRRSHRPTLQSVRKIESPPVTSRFKTG